MKNPDLNTALLDNYLGLIKNLSPEIKLDLIERITKTLKGNLTKKNGSITDAFGKWKSKKSADEIITEIRNSRTFNRDIEML